MPKKQSYGNASKSDAVGLAVKRREGARNPMDPRTALELAYSENLDGQGAL
jgi:hypothetical protein